jgi:hypothetical protein
MSRDFVFGCAMLALSGGYFLMAASLPQSLLDDAIGPQGLPKAYAYLLGALSVIQIVRSLPRRSSGVAAADPSRKDPSHGWWRPVGILLIGVAYLAIVPWLGYAVSLAGLIFATIRYQRGDGVWRAAVVATTGAVFFWLLFVRLLGIPQPAGFWSFLFQSPMR